MSPLSYKAKFFDGETARTQNVRLEIDLNNLKIISSDDESLLDIWQISEVSFDESHFRQKVLKIEHEPEARLELLDDDILTELSKLNSKLVLSSSKVLIIKLLTTLILIILAGFLFWKLGTNWIVNRISDKTEFELADKLNLTDAIGTCRLNSEGDLALKKVIKRIYPLNSRDQEHLIRVSIAQRSESNAFTFPGGQIVLLTGLISQADSGDEVAAVLAHEIGHVTQRHVLKSIVRGTFLTSLLNLVSGNVSGLVLIDPATLWQIASLSFDRNAEREADLLAIDRLNAAQVDLSGYAHFFSKTSLLQKNFPVLLWNHPGDDERVQLIETHRKKKSQLSPVLSSSELVALKHGCSPP